MRNRFPGTCATCKTKVYEGAGTYDPSSKKTYCSQHAPGMGAVGEAGVAQPPARIAVKLIGRELAFSPVDFLGGDRFNLYRKTCSPSRFDGPTKSQRVHLTAAADVFRRMREAGFALEIPADALAAVEASTVAQDDPSAPKILDDLVKVTLVGGEVSFAPVGHLGAKFDAYKNACAGARFERASTPPSQRANLDLAVEILQKLRAESFALDVDPEATAAFKARAETRVADVAGAEARAAEIDANLKKRGLGLYGYQREGTVWLADRLGGLLADSMGLGKSVQVLAMLPDRPSVVVVCPAVAKGVWQREQKKWRPDLRTSVLDGRGSFRWPEPGEIVITNYDILPGEIDKTTKAVVGFPEGAPPGLILVADEAHALANGKSARTQKFRALSDAARKGGGRAYALTATPIKNTPPELWSVLKAIGLEREAFGSWDNFVRLFNGYKTQYGIEWGEAKPEVAELLKKVQLRRIKTEVLKDLPPKTYREISAPIDKATARACDAALVSLDQNGVHIEDAITELAKNELSFQELSAARALMAKAKFPTTLELVAEYESANEPVLVFSGYRAVIDSLAKRPGWVVITGDTPASTRTQIETDFQAGQYKGVACTIRAGGVAITLTRASNVIFNDEEWNPSLNEQAQDRAHRIGSTRGVLITRVVADHPLDEKIAAVIGRKERLIDGSVNAAAVTHVAPPKAPVQIDFDKLEAEAKLAMQAAYEHAQAELVAKTEYDREVEEQKKKLSVDRVKNYVAEITARRADKNVEDLPQDRREPMTEEEAWAADGVIALAAMDQDHAAKRNEMGYSKSDGGLGHSMAWLLSSGMGLTDDEWKLAIRLAHHYQGQIGSFDGTPAKVRLRRREAEKPSKARVAKPSARSASARSEGDGFREPLPGSPSQEAPYASVVIVPHPTDPDRFVSVKSAKRGLRFGFPGGKVEPGESPEQAGAREVKEETGIVVLDIAPMGASRDDGGHLVALFYAARWRGELRSSAEGEAVWASRTELTSDVTSAYPAFNRAAFSALDQRVTHEDQRAPKNSVDPELWKKSPRFGVAGGPETLMLTEEGEARVFSVGAKVRQGPSADALRALAARGGEAFLEEARAAPSASRSRSRPWATRPTITRPSRETDAWCASRGPRTARTESRRATARWPRGPTRS